MLLVQNLVQHVANPLNLFVSSQLNIAMKRKVAETTGDIGLDFLLSGGSSSLLPLDVSEIIAEETMVAKIAVEEIIVGIIAEMVVLEDLVWEEDGGGGGFGSSLSSLPFSGHGEEETITIIVRGIKIKSNSVGY